MIDQSRSAAVTRLTLNRPDRLNAFTGDGYKALRLGVQQASADPETRVIVITGRGRAFSAGADRSLLDGSASEAARHTVGTEFRAMLGAIDQCRKPIIAAVNGLAVGIGCTLLLHCDLVVMAESARLRLPFTALGIVPEAGSSVLLPARTRWPDALWAMLSSEWIDSAEAYGMGLVWRVVPDDRVVYEAEHAAATLAALDPVSVEATKHLLMEGRRDAVEAALDRESDLMTALMNRKLGRS